MPLCETEIAIEAVDQNLEGILQRVEMMPVTAVTLLVGSLHLPLGFETEFAQVRQQMPKDLKLIGGRKAVELQHDRGIKRSDIAVPDVASDPGKIDGGEASFEAHRHRHFRNAVTLPQVFAQKERVNAGGVAAHDHILIIVGKDLRLNKITRA